MSGKRKSTPNKFDADSNSSQGLEGASAETGRQFQFNLNDIAVSAGNMQKQIPNNNNNYNETEVVNFNVKSSTECDSICNSEVAAVVVGDDEGEGESEDKGEDYKRMGLGLGLCAVLESDDEHTDLDIDIRSISPRVTSNASADESDTDNVSHSSHHTLATASPTKKRYKKTSRLRLLNGSSKMARAQQTSISGYPGAQEQNPIKADALGLYPVNCTDGEAIQRFVNAAEDDIEDTNLTYFKSEYSTVIKQELNDKLETPPPKLSAIVTEDEPMEHDVIGKEQRIFHIPCRNSASTIKNFDEHYFPSRTEPLIVPPPVFDTFGKQSVSENVPLPKSTRENSALTARGQSQRSYGKDRTVSEMIQHLQLIRSKLINQVTN